MFFFLLLLSKSIEFSEFYIVFEKEKVFFFYIFFIKYLFTIYPFIHLFIILPYYYFI